MSDQIQGIGTANCNEFSLSYAKQNLGTKGNDPANDYSFSKNGKAINPGKSGPSGGIGNGSGK